VVVVVLTSMTDNREKKKKKKKKEREKLNGFCLRSERSLGWEGREVREGVGEWEMGFVYSNKQNNEGCKYLQVLSLLS